MLLDVLMNQGGVLLEICQRSWMLACNYWSKIPQLQTYTCTCTYVYTYRLLDWCSVTLYLFFICVKFLLIMNYREVKYSATVWSKKIGITLTEDGKKRRLN